MLPSRPRILVFCRPYLVQDFRANFQPLAAEYDFFFLTDGRGDGDGDTREAFYRHYRRTEETDLLTAPELDDIIIRCRLLRNLDPAEARRRAVAMSAAVGEWYARTQPLLTISHAVDDYVTHILSLLARKRGIMYLAYNYSYFPGYAQALSYDDGRPFAARSVEDMEAAAICQAITDKAFRQDYGQNTGSYSFPRHILRVLRYYLKRAIFAYRGLVERDRLHLHYQITRYLAERRNFLNFPRASVFEADWRERASLGSKELPLIYIPLGFFPESTIDYWTRDVSIIHYERIILQIAENLGKGNLLLVKEHPHMMGIRPVAFYEKLKRYPNVVLVSSSEFSAEVLRFADAVLIGGGSGGVESTLAGVPVFSYCDTIYWFGPSEACFLDLGHIDRWNGLIAEGINRHHPFDDSRKRAFIKECLASTLAIRPGGRRWPLTDIGQTRQIIDRALRAGSASITDPAEAGKARRSS